MLFPLHCGETSQASWLVMRRKKLGVVLWLSVAGALVLAASLRIIMVINPAGMS